MLDLKDDGFEDVRLTSDDGTEIYATKLDLWETYNHLADIQRQTAGQPAYAYHQAIVDYLKEKGFPEVSHRFADRFASGIISRVGEVKNSPAGEPPHDSPASTASTPSS